MKPTMTLEQVKKLGPCRGSFSRVSKLLEKGKAFDVAMARAAGCTLDDLIWVASAVARTDKEVKRRLRLWTADCAAHVLPIYEKTETSDAPRKAIIAARQFARGEISDAVAADAWAANADAAADADADADARADSAARATAWAADAAVRATADAAAWAADSAARAAAWAADAAATATADAWAAAAATADDDDDATAWAADAAAAAWAAESNWQFDRLVEWFSDNGPEEWPLDNKE